MTDRTQEARRLMGEIRYQVFSPEVTTVCEWRKMDEYGDHVGTSCGHDFILNDADDYKDGEQVFPHCCYCAKPLS